MSSLQFTAADYDEAGFVRPIATLLPTPPDEAPTRHAAAPPRARLIAFAVAGLLFIGIALFSLGRSVETPAARPLGGATAIATARITLIPQPTPVARLLVAFAAPGGLVLGAIESSREMTATGRYGDDWTQFDVLGSGLVWLHAGDVSGLVTAGLPDLRPRPTVAPSPVAAPEIAPAPTVCARVGTAGDMIEKCGYDTLDNLEVAARAEWIARSGASVVTVTTPTPMSYK